MLDAKIVAQAIEDDCRAALNASYKNFPQGCDEDQMRDFLKAECKYPGIAYAIIMGWEYQSLIEKEVLKYGK